MRIPVNFSQVNLRFTGVVLPRGAEVTFGVFQGSGVGPASTADKVLANWTSNLKSIQSSQITLASILVKNGPNVDGPFIELGVGTAGSDGSGIVGPQVCALIRKNTNFGGRKGRGRLYWPGVLRDDAGGDGVISGSQITAYNSAWNSFLDDMAADDAPLYLLHADSTSPYQIASFSAQTPTATQRRRIRA